MKILGSFNTKLDEHELYTAIQENGQGNAIMMKKHRIYLIRPIIWMLFALITFCLLIWFAYSQFFYSENRWIFRILAILYSLVTLTRCIHSITMIMSDIQVQINNRYGYIDKIDESEFKDGKYEIFLKHTLISSGLQVVLMLINSSASFLAGSDTKSIFFNIVGIIVNISFIFLLYKVLDRIIDYEMDFNIFTVDQFMLFRQHGFLKAESMNIATSTIKIVKETKSGFLGSRLDYGKVSIHPEGNISGGSKIELFYVPKPKTLVKKLNEFIEKSKEGMNISVMS